MHPPFGVGVNGGKQIPQLVMRSPPPLDLGKESKSLMHKPGIHMMWQRLRHSLRMRSSSLFLRITNFPTKRSLEEKSTVSITTPGIIVLMLVGVLGILSKT